MSQPQRSGSGLSRIRRLSLLLIVLCLIQYLLGMALTLFVVITRNHPGSSGDDYLARSFRSVVWGIGHGGFLALHVGLGIVLVLGSIRFAVATFYAPQIRVRTVGTLAAVAVLAAAFNGASFLNYNDDASSMIMAVFFAIAVLCFAWALFRASATVALPSAG
ncbi:MAG TPA: hypothetical protein VMW80_05665 [Candidatus Dormibacteraeota bacterium]|nr:hypothetical protein [Candidatus Dormibacteraeota bacterium]